MAGYDQLTPVVFGHIDAESPGGVDYPLPRPISLLVRNPLDLVEAGDGVAHVGGVSKRFLTLVDEGELIPGKAVLVSGAQAGGLA
jgi:hypothetical protein